MHTQNHYLCSNHSTSVPHRHTNKSKMLRHFYRALHKLVVVMVAVIWLLKSFFYLLIFGCKIVYQIHFLCRLHCTSYARLFIFQYRSAHGSYNVLKWVHCVVQWHRLLCVLPAACVHFFIIFVNYYESWFIFAENWVENKSSLYLCGGVRYSTLFRSRSLWRLCIRYSISVISQGVHSTISILKWSGWNSLTFNWKIYITRLNL